MSAFAAKLKKRAKGDFKGRLYEAALIVQTASWYLRYCRAAAALPAARSQTPRRAVSVDRLRSLTPEKLQLTVWLTDKKSDEGGVTIGADRDPTYAEECATKTIG